LGGNGNHFYGTKQITTPFVFKDCQFSGGNFSPGGSGDVSVAITNCLWERVYLTLDENKYDPVDWIFNCLFRGGKLSLNNSGTATWILKGQSV